MTTRALHPGAEVEVDVRGLVFPATVKALPGGQAVDVQPSVRNVSYRRVRARQIRRVLRPAPAGGQLAIGGLG